MRIFGVTTFAILLSGLTASAGEWHVGSTLQCQDCHLQHSSEEGEELSGGPFSTLLLKSSINELCLSCHNGADPAAPDVQAPVQMYQSTVSGESSAGWFSLLGMDNHAGHTLGLPSITPLQAEGRLVDLNCNHCHAVHGNENYRNLRYDPAERGDSILLVDGVHLFTQVKPSNPPTIAATVAAYERNNVGYSQGYTAWCGSCHDQVGVNAESLDPAHFNSHPSDLALDAFGLASHTDPLHWVGGIGEGFVGPGSDPGSGIARVPFMAPAASGFTTARTPHGSNQVGCVSCHQAHGGANAHAMRWPYLEGGSAFLSGCQQCHNK